MNGIGDLNVLPKGILLEVLSLTTPKDVGRLSAVSSALKSIAESDEVWELFLPPDYQQIILQSDQPYLLNSSKKQLFLSLSLNTLLIDHRKMSFWLDIQSGKKCFMLSAKDLTIAWINDARYWGWGTHPVTSFDEVAMLKYLWWFDICGKISTSLLSPKTNYAAYFLFDETERIFGFGDRPVDVSVGLVGTEGNKRSVYLAGDEANCDGQYRREREDRWFEIELGEFYNDDFNSGELEMRVSEVIHYKGGLIVEGIMLRPKEANC